MRANLKLGRCPLADWRSESFRRFFAGNCYFFRGNFLFNLLGLSIFDLTSLAYDQFFTFNQTFADVAIIEVQQLG